MCLVMESENDGPKSACLLKTAGVNFLAGKQDYDPVTVAYSPKSTQPLVI
jgi:hypothetical protein